MTEIPSYMKTDNMTLQFAGEDSAATTPDLVVASNVIKKLTISSNTVETEKRYYVTNSYFKVSCQSHYMTGAAFFRC
ncbi:hypothetical protein [Paenibacillus sp.]|uniref:hypothetical protein n=1 Tax=Paenibacillus sp. TaxID=58172 RepID=UPI0028AF7678|nr:hypothetical protein [Paenibacillus sp.]